MFDIHVILTQQLDPSTNAQSSREWSIVFDNAGYCLLKKFPVAKHDAKIFMQKTTANKSNLSAQSFIRLVLKHGLQSTVEKAFSYSFTRVWEGR